MGRFREGQAAPVAGGCKYQEAVGGVVDSASGRLHISMSKEQRVNRGRDKISVDARITAVYKIILNTQTQR